MQSYYEKAMYSVAIFQEAIKICCLCIMSKETKIPRKQSQDAESSVTLHTAINNYSIECCVKEICFQIPMRLITVMNASLFPSDTNKNCMLQI